MLKYFLMNNLVLIIALFAIYLYIKWKNYSDGFFQLFSIFTRYYFLILCPVIVFICNLISILRMAKYKYIWETLISLLIPLGVFVYEYTSNAIYKYKYRTYNKTVCGITKYFLNKKNINMKNSYLSTSYAKITYSEESKGKTQCCVHIVIYDESLDCNYLLLREVEKYLKTSLPKIYFTARIENKSMFN